MVVRGESIVRHPGGHHLEGTTRRTELHPAGGAGRLRKQMQRFVFINLNNNGEL